MVNRLVQVRRQRLPTACPISAPIDCHWQPRFLHNRIGSRRLDAHEEMLQAFSQVGVFPDHRELLRQNFAAGRIIRVAHRPGCRPEARFLPMLRKQIADEYKRLAIERSFLLRAQVIELPGIANHVRRMAGTCHIICPLHGDWSAFVSYRIQRQQNLLVLYNTSVAVQRKVSYTQTKLHSCSPSILTAVSRFRELCASKYLHISFSDFASCLSRQQRLQCVTAKVPETCHGPPHPYSPIRRIDWYLYSNTSALSINGRVPSSFPSHVALDSTISAIKMARRCDVHLRFVCSSHCQAMESPL